MGEENEYPGMPRWVKFSGVVLGVLVLLAAMFIAFDIGGPHGPGRHMSTHSESPAEDDRP